MFYVFQQLEGQVHLLVSEFILYILDMYISLIGYTANAMG